MRIETPPINNQKPTQKRFYSNKVQSIISWLQMKFSSKKDGNLEYDEIIEILDNVCKILDIIVPDISDVLGNVLATLEDGIPIGDIESIGVTTTDIFGRQISITDICDDQWRKYVTFYHKDIKKSVPLAFNGKGWFGTKNSKVSPNDAVVYALQSAGKRIAALKASAEIERTINRAHNKIKLTKTITKENVNDYEKELAHALLKLQDIDNVLATDIQTEIKEDDNEE